MLPEKFFDQFCRFRVERFFFRLRDQCRVFFLQRSQVRDLRDQRFLDVGALFRRRQHVLLVITANPRQAQFDLRQHPDARQPVGRDVGRCLIYLVQFD